MRKEMMSGLRAGLFGICAYVAVRLWTDHGWIALTVGIIISSCFALLYTLAEKGGD